MSSWSQRRRYLYASVVGVVLVGAVIVPAFFVLYHPPTCSDGRQNGGEQGVDCGGSCQRLCASAFLAPSVAWTRFEQVASGSYTVASYIVNPNTAGEAVDAPYHFMLYDDRGILIVEKNGTVTLPPHRNTLAFAPLVDTGKRIPAKTLFEFTAAPDWRLKADPLAGLSIGDKKYSEDATGSSLLVLLSNKTTAPIGRMTVYAVLYDADGNALGFSKTIVDGIPPGGMVTAPYTWPVSRNGRVISIEVLPVAE